jgi:hypothetical protein
VGPKSNALCTGPDLGFDGTGALRVTSTRQMPLPTSLAPGSGWSNGLRLDAGNGLWAAQCAPAPVTLSVSSTTTVPVSQGVLQSFTIAPFTLSDPSVAQPAAFFGDLQCDALVYTNSSAWAEMWVGMSYTPCPGGPTSTLNNQAVDSISPNIPITPALAAAGAASFVWRPQAKLGLGLWFDPGQSPGVTVQFGIKNVTDNFPSTPLPLQVVSWSVALNGTVWLIDTGPVT